MMAFRLFMSTHLKVWRRESNPRLPVRASRTQTGPFSVWGKHGERDFSGKVPEGSCVVSISNKLTASYVDSGV